MKLHYIRTKTVVAVMVTMAMVAIFMCYSNNNNNIIITIIIIIIMMIMIINGVKTIGLLNVRNLICRLYQVVTLLRLPTNVVLACKLIGQSKKKCSKLSRAALHLQGGSDTSPPRNGS
jgi:hypothetical protein